MPFIRQGPNPLLSAPQLARLSSASAPEAQTLPLEWGLEHSHARADDPQSRLQSGMRTLRILGAQRANALQAEPSSASSMDPQQSKVMFVENLVRSHADRHKAEVELGWELMHEALVDLESELRNDFEEYSAETDSLLDRQLYHSLSNPDLQKLQNASKALDKTVENIMATRQSLLYLCVWYDPELSNLIDEIQRSYVHFFQHSEQLRRDWSEHDQDWQQVKLQRLGKYVDYVNETLPQLATHPKCLISPQHIHEIQQAAKEEELCQRMEYVADGEEKPKAVMEVGELADRLCNIGN